jgi:hypothetical protein
MNFNFHKNVFILVQSTFIIALLSSQLSTSLQPPKLTCPCNLHSGINPLLSLRARRFVTQNYECVLIASSNHVMKYPTTIHFYSTKILATWFLAINTAPSQQQFNCILQTNIDYTVIFLPF